MPFVMTHLCIAKNISGHFSDHINDLSQFYLGNIAPDAVHNREGYISDYKKASHLCVGDEKWGMITNNNEWIDNVLRFLGEYKNSMDHSFILGYCSHILSDIYNNIAVWTPFKQKYIDMGRGGLYHSESEKIDVNLALTLEGKDDFWRNLENSREIDVEKIIFADEIEEQKINILHRWFTDKELQDVSLNEVVTYDSTIQFINNASQFVSDNLAKILTE